MDEFDYEDPVCDDHDDGWHAVDFGGEYDPDK